jgi:hypothetical protein
MRASKAHHGPRLLRDHDRIAPQAAGVRRARHAADRRILLPSQGGEATLLKIAAPCDDRGMATRRFPAPWRADKMPGGYVVRDANGQALVYVYSRENEAKALQAKVLTADEASTSRSCRGC